MSPSQQEDCCRTYYSGSVLTSYCVDNSLIFDTPLNNLNTPISERVTRASGKCFRRRCRYYPWWGYESEIGSETETCIIDGQEPDYMQDDAGTWMFDTLESCCLSHFWWEVPACTASGGRQPGKFLLFSLVKTTGGQPDYMTDVFWIWMFETVESCCNHYFQYDEQNCLKKGNIIT